MLFAFLVQVLAHVAGTLRIGIGLDEAFNLYTGLGPLVGIQQRLNLDNHLFNAFLANRIAVVISLPA